MSRTLLVLLALARFAHAQCTTTLGAKTARALAVTIADGVFQPPSIAAFPAVSADGSTLVELFDDAQDFTGFPITSLVLWSVGSGNQLESFVVGGQPSGDTTAILAKANARLAKTTWRGATTYTPCGHDDDTLQASGTTVAFSRDKQDVRVGARHVSFPPPGSASKEVGGGGCGTTLGFARAFGAGKLVVLVPHVELGGDSCFGSPSAELALAVRLP
jgi:hypothetical protein